MSKAKKKDFVLLSPCDFPYDPTTGKLIHGVTSMTFIDEFGYDLTKYLEKRIKEGVIALKDVAEEIFDYLNAGSWDEFCDTYDSPETNADAFSDWLVDCDAHSWGHIFVVETEDTIIFCPIDGEYECDTAEDLTNIVQGICGMYASNNQDYNLNSSKLADFTPNMQHCEDKETAPAVDRITAPIFKSL